MAYFVRVLSLSAEVPVVSALAKSIGRGRLRVLEGDPEDWVRLELAHANKVPIAIIERNAVADGDLAVEELAEFDEELAEALPRSGAAWVRAFLPRVQTLYAIEVLDGAFADDGWWKIDAVRTALWKLGGGILQSDAEGFSNEAGHYIVWQFHDPESTPWEVALLQPGPNGEQWVAFVIDLANPGHRSAFLRGEIPAGVTRL